MGNLLYELNQYDKFLETRFDNLNETRGIYNLTYHILNACYDYIKPRLNQLMFIKTDNGSNYYTGSFVILLNDDSFIVNPVIRLTIKIGDMTEEPTGGFITPTIDMIQDNKLVEPVFRIELSERSKDEITYESFKQLMLHEIHHAYRWFNINVKSPCDSKERNKKNIYYQINKLKDKDEIDRIVYSIFYLTDEDEVNAFSAEIYGIVEDNPEINIGNYRYYYDIFPAYRHINSLIRFLEWFKNGDDNTNHFVTFKGEISNRMNFIFKTKNNSDKNREILIAKISNRILVMKKQFHKVLEKALTDFQRPYNMTESNRNIGRFLMEDILNTCIYLI